MQPAALSATCSSALPGPLPPRRALALLFGAHGEHQALGAGSDVPGEARCRRDGAEKGRVCQWLRSQGSHCSVREPAPVPPAPPRLWLLRSTQGIRVGRGGAGPLRRGLRDRCVLASCILRPEPGSHASTRLLARPWRTGVETALARAWATCHTGEGWRWRRCPEDGVWLGREGGAVAVVAGIGGCRGSSQTPALHTDRHRRRC